MRRWRLRQSALALVCGGNVRHRVGQQQQCAAFPPCDPSSPLHQLPSTPPTILPLPSQPRPLQLPQPMPPVPLEHKSPPPQSAPSAEGIWLRSWCSSEAIFCLAQTGAIARVARRASERNLMKAGRIFMEGPAGDLGLN